MTYDLLYYVIPKYDSGIDEIPLVVEWEIDEAPAGYPSARDPFEEATEPRPLVCGFHLQYTEDGHSSYAWWTYIATYAEEILEEVQASTALQEAFDDVINP